jgi:hypothetical protein
MLGNRIVRLSFEGSLVALFVAWAVVMWGTAYTMESVPPPPPPVPAAVMPVISFFPDDGLTGAMIVVGWGVGPYRATVVTRILPDGGTEYSDHTHDPGFRWDARSNVPCVCDNGTLNADAEEGWMAHEVANVWVCDVCHHRWLQTNEIPPKQCARCKTRDWNFRTQHDAKVRHAPATPRDASASVKPVANGFDAPKRKSRKSAAPKPKAAKPAASSDLFERTYEPVEDWAGCWWQWNSQKNGGRRFAP